MVQNALLGLVRCHQPFNSTVFSNFESGFTQIISGGGSTYQLSNTPLQNKNKRNDRQAKRQTATKTSPQSRRATLSNQSENLWGRSLPSLLPFMSPPSPLAAPCSLPSSRPDTKPRHYRHDPLPPPSYSGLAAPPCLAGVVSQLKLSEAWLKEVISVSDSG